MGALGNQALQVRGYLQPELCCLLFLLLPAEVGGRRKGMKDKFANFGAEKHQVLATKVHGAMLFVGSSDASNY